MEEIKSKFQKRRDITVYVILRGLVILTLIMQIIHRNFENVFLCVLTLFLLLLPLIIDHKLNIKLPTVLESLIFVFIFAAEILGEVYNFYGHVKNWDTILHTINGFLCAAIGFSLVDILNQSSKIREKLSPVFVALVAFCVSMTIGVLWEFAEFGTDVFLKTDMQKDTVINEMSSVNFNEEHKNKAVILENIFKTQIFYKNGDKNEVLTIGNGYIDTGLIDTMEDLFVNFVGAVVFSILGFLYIKNRDKYKFAENFMPSKKTPEEIEESKIAEENYKKSKKKWKNK